MTDADLESELAGLAEEEFGMDSGAMFNDLHAPSVPVQPLDGGHASSTTKYFSRLLIFTKIYSIPILQNNKKMFFSFSYD
ncbi:unnamed protein product [Adineta steineri]|uniref:Uncharacterized protein n=1 Tax=Adineta steineri TaxID=433720 RepID=A0A820S5B4_9BILA|nr:unnamed protein product [Adineta steineri]